MGAADLDPIWMCEEITLCKKTTCTKDCVTIRSVSANPTSVAAGGTFNWTITFTVNSPDVGVSTVALGIRSKTPDSKGKYFTDSVVGFIPQPTTGAFGIVLPEKTETPDPMGGPGFPFPAGAYTSSATYCEGQCGSDHKGSGEVLGQRAGPNVTITGM